MNHSLKYIIENHLTESHWISLIRKQIQEKVVNILNEASEDEKEHLIRRVRRLATASGLALARGMYDKSRDHDRRAGDVLHQVARKYFSDEKGNLTPKQLSDVEGMYRDKEATIRRVNTTSYGRYNRQRPGQNIDLKA